MTSSLTALKARSDRIPSRAISAPRVSESARYLARTPFSGLYAPRVGYPGRIAVTPGSSLLGGGIIPGGLFASGATPYTALFEAPEFPAVAEFNVVDFGAVGGNANLDTAAWQNCITAALAVGGGSIYAPALSQPYYLKNQLGHLDTGLFRIHGDGVGETVLQIVHDLGGDPLFDCLGRHGVGDTTRVGPFLFEDMTIRGDGTHAGGAFDFWQAADAVWRNMAFEDLIGSAIIATACDRPYIHDVTFTNCGSTADGQPAIYMKLSDEGGTIGNQYTYDPVFRAITVTENPDIAVRWWGVRSSGQGAWLMDSTLDSSGFLCSVFEGIDCVSATIDSCTVSNGSDDNVRWMSQGNSAGNSVSNSTLTGAQGITPGSGYGVNTYAPVPAQAHTTTLTNNTYSGNAAGDHSP